MSAVFSSVQHAPPLAEHAKVCNPAHPLAQLTWQSVFSGAGKRVMGGGGPMSQTAQQAELKLEQMVDQRDMAIANASVNGDAGIETITNQEILPISEVLLRSPALT